MGRKRKAEAAIDDGVIAAVLRHPSALQLGSKFYCDDKLFVVVIAGSYYPSKTLKLVAYLPPNTPLSAHQMEQLYIAWIGCGSRHSINKDNAMRLLFADALRA
jgi:hypothetical protein